MPADVRIKPDTSADVDLEPEYVAVSEDGTKAWVSLQENNAVAIVDIPGEQITAVKSLGAKDFGLIDIDDDETALLSEAPANVFGLFMPDTMASYRVNGKDYFVSANEGDDREYDNGYEDLSKARKLDLPVSLQLQDDVVDVEEKEDLRVFNDMGINGGIYTEFYIAGTRSFSIWDADGNLVWDSGAEFESYLQANATYFNTEVDDSDDIGDADGKPTTKVGDDYFFWADTDARSQKKGCEPEALALARIGEKTFAYIGLEKQGGFFVYDITDPTKGEMVEYVGVDYSKAPGESDIAPEGMVTFEQDNKYYLAVANEGSSTVSLYRLNATTGEATKMDSVQVGTFDGGAAEIVSYDEQGKQLFTTNGEESTVDIIDVSDPTDIKKTGSIDFSEYATNLQSVSVKKGLVAIAVARPEEE